MVETKFALGSSPGPAAQQRVKTLRYGRSAHALTQQIPCLAHPAHRRKAVGWRQVWTRYQNTHGIKLDGVSRPVIIKTEKHECDASCMHGGELDGAVMNVLPVQNLGLHFEAIPRLEHSR